MSDTQTDNIYQNVAVPMAEGNIRVHECMYCSSTHMSINLVVYSIHIP